MVDFRFDVRVTPMELKIQNEEEVAKGMAQAIWRLLTSRLANGNGAEGALPRTKDGDAPMNRTGTLQRSIDIALRQRSNDSWDGIVRCFGDRPATENVKGKKRAATRKTRQLRAAVVIGAVLSGKVDPRLRRKTPTKTGKMLKLGRVRVRAAVDNASLAAILSVPPRDVRGRNGNRGVYRVFEKNDTYVDAAFAVVKRVLRVRLDAKGG